MPTDLILLDEASWRLEQSKISGSAFAELLCKIQPLLWGLFPDRRVRDSIDLSRITRFRTEPGNVVLVDDVRWTEVQLSWRQLCAAFTERGYPVSWTWFLDISPEFLERASRFDRTYLDVRVLMRPAQVAPQPTRRGSPDWFAAAVYNTFVPASGKPPRGKRGPRSGKRDNAAAALRGGGEPDRLVAAYDQAARDRNEAFAAADATARALAESRARNAISLDELRRALQDARRARQSEQKLAANLGRAPASQPNASPDPLQRLRTVPMPPEPPFIAATARYLSAHPSEERALDSWPSQLTDERVQVRASLAQLHGTDRGTADLGPADDDETLALEGEPDSGADAGTAAAPDSESVAPDADAGAAARGGTGAVQVSGDLKRLLARRGPPLRIAQRPDGLTAFRYTEKRPCGVDQCIVSVDYLFNPSGRLVRSEVVKP